MKDMYFGDDFGQKIDLTVRIREILRNYPEGTSIFKEMIQNADDAGATEISLCLDYRQHAVTGLAYEKLGPFQGPSLLVHNNATFTDADFQSIQRIGDSLKKDNSKGWKTGRFGVGFNSVYHVTDLPAFVSGSHLVFFDPQACHLPHVNPSNPGKIIDYIAHPDLLNNFPDQISPFQCFGCNFAEPFPGTIFRLALRTVEQAQYSKLSHRAQTPGQMSEMLKEFAGSLPTVLLFLRNVCKISIMEWRVGNEVPTILQEALLSNMTPEIKAKRSLQHTTLTSFGQSNQKFATEGIVCDYALKIVVCDCTASLSKEYEYLVMNQLGGGECSGIACNPANVNHRLVPWGGVAVPTTASCEICTTSGLAFCFLPLPTHTYLPVHVNGYFELSSNRRDIWFGEGLSGEGLLRAQWNIALLRDVIAPCYARVILHLANEQVMAPDQHVKLLPHALPPAPWDSLTDAFFALIRSKPCLYSEVGGGRWVSPTTSMVIRSSHLSSEHLKQLMIDDGFPVVRNLAEELERVLVMTKTIPSYVEPPAVREVYKMKHSVHAGDREATECLLSFMLSDLEPDTLTVLVGVHFLPVADGTLRTFESRPKFNPSELEYLRSMGFSRQHAIFALAIAGDHGAETALDWLLQNPNPSIVCEERANTLFLIPTREELAILDKARGHLINVEVMNERALTLLSSNVAGKLLNVQKLDYVGFEDMLAVVLPASWFGKQTVPWTETADEDTPNAEWFRQLWKYLGRSKHLSAFEDKWPIVPTSSGTLAQLSRSAGVLSAELIPEGCLRCLEKLQVRLLLPNLFASFQPHPDVWQYIHQPTTVGVLSCIEVIVGAGRDLALSTLVNELFEYADRLDREHLLRFLASAVLEDVGSSLKRICCNLPIFPGFRDVSCVENRDVDWVSSDHDLNDMDRGFSPVFVSLAEISARYQKPLLCVGVAPKFLDDNFVFVKEGDSLLLNFLLHLGVQRVSKVELFAKFLIPRFGCMTPKACVESVYELLVELNALLEQDSDGVLLNTIETAAIYPTMIGEMKPIGDLYDPEVVEFIEIMDESFFPAVELQDPQPLAALRSIGLQRTLSRRSILSLAMSLEQDQMKISSASPVLGKSIGLDEMCEKLRVRSFNFFQYVDTHMSQLVALTPLQKRAPTQTRKVRKNRGMRLLRNFIRDDRSSVLDTATENKTPPADALEEQAIERAEIEDFKAKLAIIMWIPVCEKKPHSTAPWYKDGERIIVASPQQSRPLKHLWLCSSQFHVIKFSVHSEMLRSVLGWEERLPVDTIALQLKEISLLFDKRRLQVESDLNVKTISDGDTHVVWSAVYNIYQHLSRFFETEQVDERRNQVLRILSGNGKYVWVGDCFVLPSHVATVAVVNAEPYMYTIPNELLHFRPFLRAIGVRERFALADYVHVLGVMHKEQLVEATTENDDAKAVQLSGDKLTMVIGLIQLISDTLQHHSDFELFAPDRNGVLESTARLTYDDAPWLDKRDYETSSGIVQFIHPKISNEVAAKIGCCSLRSQLLSESGHEALSFGNEGNVEVFGQTEALTKRIAHILEQYPDGPNIFSELLQNADDAGATRVCLLYNSCSYGVSSLLSPAMAKWQGPSLFCYNDAEFSDRDFINLARIGQASKLQRAGTTGRFGLGFNSVYHFTDLPSIVSAKSIVMFDPHATHLPGISAANPGIKIRFANASIVKQFPDQFAPFKDVFGCDLKHHYKGTLFRFPLRNSTLAECSEIKRRGYSHHEIVELFKSFQESIVDTMLFLRNVCTVEVYFQSDIKERPMLLYGAEVSEGDRGESWRKIDRFMCNDGLLGNTPGMTKLSAKSEFYTRLRSIPSNELPSVTQVLHIRRRQQKELESLFHRFDVESVILGTESSEAETDHEMDETTETYLVCNQLGGGHAQEMACATENEGLKLIPWVGIAGRIDGVPINGRAFCFLPLPVRVGLPVHINAYFELSSNRRDIWIGDDMSGDGKLRSEWNASLLVDAVAPAYLTFLLKAKVLCEENPDQYFSFFPSKLPASPWDSITLELFRIMKNRPMFFVSTTQLQSNTSVETSREAVAPGSCVLVDDSLSDCKTLEIALSAASLVTVYVPVALRNLLIELDAVYGVMTPAFFRQLTGPGTFLPTLDQNTLQRVIQFCLSDCQNSANSFTETLSQLPLLPLKDGKFGRICLNDKTLQSNDCQSEKQQLTYFFGSVIEEQLLADFPHRVVRREFKKIFDQVPFVYENSNLSEVDLGAILDIFLPHVLGRCWNKLNNDVFSLHPASQMKDKIDWIRLLWNYVEAQLQTTEQLPQTFTKCPLTPIMCDDKNQWICLSANVSLVLPHSEASVLSSDVLHQLLQILSKVGVYVMDTTYLAGERSVQWLLAYKFAHKLTSDGLLAALTRCQRRHNRQSFDEIFAATTPADRQVLCNFFSQNTFDAMSNDFRPILSELPIFPVHSMPVFNTASSQHDDNMQFVSLKRGGYLPDTSADTRILDDSFFCVEAEATRRFLRDYGIEELSYTSILLNHVFPQLPLLERQHSNLVDSVIVGALETLPLHQRNDALFRKVISTHAIIPNRKRIFRAISQLHDPSVSELSELVGENSLPAHAFSTLSIVTILRSLGLRTGLSCHAVLESARSIAAMYKEDDDELVSQACLKAHSLLTIVNKHFDSMMPETSSTDCTDDEEKDSEQREMQETVAVLKEVQWLPVLVESPEPAMPWKRSAGSGQQTLLSSASDMRPLKDAWFCSSSTNILDGELTSERLVAEFGWKEQVGPFVIAKQLEAIGSLWEEHCRKKDAGPVMSLTNLPHWRFPLSEVHSMYESLESYRLSDEEGWMMTPWYRKLANALWIWTGKGFAYPCQFAVVAHASLEPLLYSCPSEHIISRSLLASFGVRDTFSTVDYLEAIMRLPRNIVLSEKQVVACLKIYELLAEDTPALDSALNSFPPQEMVLMDQTNHLVPAIQLTFDDMEWDESREVRRGARFVSRKISQTVARLLGATSLHLKLAQSSVSSQLVVCPPADALQSVLPPQSKWHRALLWETILAAERLGGTQVDFFVDYRHHSSQRVIEPSLQPLQDEALCIHIHGVVLSENDINNLFHQESLRAGLLCGFIVSDCMQILSGEGFYILDPMGCYLSSSARATASASGRATCIGRRYEVLSQEFVRYPDQLLPLTTLPSCPSNVSRGTQSTLIRFPWRKTGSTVSSYVLDSKKVDKAITWLKSQLFQTLIFTESVHHISLWTVGKESEFAIHCHGEVYLDTPELTLRKRNMTCQNQEWKKKFSLQSFFKNAVIPENQMEFVVNLELENRQFRDTWLFADNNGWGRSRDLACTPVHEMLHSTPYVSVASHILRNSSPAPRLHGNVYETINTGQLVDLPVHINGCFKRTTKDKNLALTLSSSQVDGGDVGGASGSEQQIAADWNRILMEDSAADAYVRLLMAAKQHYGRKFPKALYSIWPTLQKRKGEKELGALVQTHTYHLIGTREFFLCTDGIFRALSSGYQLDLGGMNLQVASFTQLHFPAFDVPTQILRDCSRLLPSSIYSVTPKVMRRFLKSQSSCEIHPDICLSLLEYCLSDLPFPLPSEMDPCWAEFHGLSLLPLEDGNIGVLQVNQRRTSYVLASFNQIELLRPLGHLFVSLVASQRLHKFFLETRFTSVFGLASFSIKILSDNVERILPSSWKNQAVVDWNPKLPTEIDQLWLYRFWQVVHFERRSLGYFAEWPLIPVKGSRLVSCSKMEMALCVWDGSADNEISVRLAEAFQASALEQEKKMADNEAEYKRFMELSAAKFKTEDNLIEDSSSDDEEDSVEESGNQDDGEMKNDGEMVSVSEESASREADHLSRMEDVAPLPAQNRERHSSLDGLLENDDIGEGVSLSPDSTFLLQEVVSNDDEVNAYDVDIAEISVGFAAPVHSMEAEPHEFCSRKTLHEVLLDLNVAMMELAYFGQDRSFVPSSADVGLAVLDGIFASVWETLRWDDLSEACAVLLAEFFSHYGTTYGGYNRIQLGELKQLPIFVNVCDMLCPIGGGQDFFLIPPDFSLTNIPLPINAQQCFLKSNPRLNAFYEELGVEEMSDSKLLIYVLPMYNELLESQRDQILQIVLQKWQSLRGNAELIALLRASALFHDGTRYCPASFFYDPRNSVLATIYDGVDGRFPAPCYRTPEWLDLMGEIGLQTEVTVDVFVECAQRIDDQCSAKQALSPKDEHLTKTLHQFFVQNFDKFDRSRSFFERVAPLAFVPAIVYDTFNQVELARNAPGQFKARSVVRKYSECATLDDQALVYSTMPILASIAQPPRILFSRLGIRSPPPQDKVVAHLLSITSSNRALVSGSLNWQFFLPMVDVFQAIFKFLQEKWNELEVKTQQRLIAATVIPVGSTLVKGSRLFFHLGENLAPLMFEVPRVFGAYDTLFRNMGSKESPEVADYIRLLRDLNDECCGHPLNLNELIAACRSIDLLAAAITESNYRLSVEEKNSIFLPSEGAVMQSMLVMAYNDSPALCSSIKLTELHVTHPRISTLCCKILGVPGITTVVTEELDGGESPMETLVGDDIAHFTSMLASQLFVDGVRKIITVQQQKSSLHDAFGFIPDFEDINKRIVSLATYEVKYVKQLQSRFMAKLDCSACKIDVTTTTRKGSLSFIDQTRRRIYIAKRTLEERSMTGMRVSHLVARCINQLLGGILQDCSVLESILTCNEVEIPEVLQRLDIYEDPVLIVEKLRGVLGQPLCEADCANVELAPLRSCLPGELVAVEDESGTLCYSKVIHEAPSDVAGISRYEVKVTSSSTRWMLATQLYFFQSARVKPSSHYHAATTGPSTRQAEDIATNESEDTALPTSVVAIASEAQSSEIVSWVKPPALMVTPANVLSAVNDLLSRLNVTLDTSVEYLMAENLRLQRCLEVAEASRRAAATQIDTIMREKKEVQDSLVCAVCLENKVNRVLIPCGHIYCASCVEQLPRALCPVCRHNISSSSVFHVPS